MRITPTALALTAAICTVPAAAMAQNPSQLLQGLLSGNQGQDQAVRDAFERGYRQGREDQRREDRERFERDRRPPPPPPPGQAPYPYPPPPYSR